VQTVTGIPVGLSNSPWNLGNIVYGHFFGTRDADIINISFMTLMIWWLIYTRAHAIIILYAIHAQKGVKEDKKSQMSNYR
jgi:hypothetical protein